MRGATGESRGGCKEQGRTREPLASSLNGDIPEKSGQPPVLGAEQESTDTLRLEAHTGGVM